MQGKRYNAEFKAGVALESLREDRSLAELSSAYGVHSAMINRWRKQLLKRTHMAFCENPVGAKEEREGLFSSLYQQIGRFKVELDWVKKRLICSSREKAALIEPDYSEISISGQYQLLGLPRSGFYYQPRGMSPLNMELMRAID